MKHCAIQQNAFTVREEMRSSIAASVSERRETMVCPKPRRIGALNPSLNDHPLRSLRRHISHQADVCESKAGSDILDILLTEDGGSDVEQVSMQLSSSHPFFSGSPPSRVSNPLTKDSRFRDDVIITQLSPLSPSMPTPSGFSSSPSSSSSARKGGCVRANFGNNPAVRIEGFDCLDRNQRRNRSIPALA